MKIIKLTGIIAFILFAGFVGWMNMTQGHFEDMGCCCGGIKYVQENDITNCKLRYCEMGCFISPWRRFFLKLSVIDFNK